MNRWSTGCQPVVNRGLCSSIGLHRISLVRASGESFRRRVFDALEGTREARFLGEQFCWHPVLPDPALPPRRAPRPDPPVVCPGFGIDRSSQGKQLDPPAPAAQTLRTPDAEGPLSQIGRKRSGTDPRPPALLLCLCVSTNCPTTAWMTFNEELANGDLEVVDKLVEVQKDARGNPPAERPRVGALKTPVTRRQMPRVGVRRRRMRAR